MWLMYVSSGPALGHDFQTVMPYIVVAVCTHCVVCVCGVCALCVYGVCVARSVCTVGVCVVLCGCGVCVIVVCIACENVCGMRVHCVCAWRVFRACMLCVMCV